MYLMIGSLECITSSCTYYTWTDTPERVRTGINYLGKARVIYNLLGMEEEATDIDKSIAKFRAHLNNSDRDDNLSVAADHTMKMMREPPMQRALKYTARLQLYGDKIRFSILK